MEPAAGQDLASKRQAVYEATASVTGRPFFEALARSLAEAVGATYGFVGRLDGGEPMTVHSLAYWGNGDFEPPISYSAEGTPCGEVLRDGYHDYRRGVAGMFPDDDHLSVMGVESYVGVRIVNAADEPLGVMSVFDLAPLEVAPELESLMHMLAKRAAAEIERVRAEEAMRRELKRSEALAQIAQHVTGHATDPAELARGVCGLVTAALDVDACQVEGLSESGDRFERWCQVGVHPHLLDEVSPGGPARAAATPGNVLVIEDPPGDAYRRADVRLLATAGCLRDARVVGSVTTHVYGRPRRLLPAELSFLRAVAGLVAAAMGVHGAHTQLRASEAKYRRIVSSTIEGVWTIDAHGVTTFANDRLGAMLGYTVDEIMGRSMFDFMDERAKHVATTNLERRSRGISERHEFRWTHKDGHDVWTLMATSPFLSEDGTFTGASAVLTDITERRDLELRIQQAQKLESLGVLAGGIAHDFNNLLVGILGNVSLAQLDLPAESPVMPALRDIQTSALRAADLTKQMLAYSGRGRFVVQRLGVNRLIEEISHLLGSVVSERAALRFSLTKDLPDVEADAAQLHQVVMNLVTNASDALGENRGLISIATGVAHVDETYLGTMYLDDGLARGEYVSIEVSDTGTGMSPETQRKIFDPFFTTKFAGRGLGLAAVLGILRGHRGAIKVYSELGKGSTIKVLLPSVSVSPPPQTASREPVDPPASSSVLVADDEIAVRLVAQRVLERRGHRVLLAEDGPGAIELLVRHGDEIGVVLLDMTMPGPSCEEVFRELRRVKPDVRVVLTSGYNEQDATSGFTGKGLAGFLPKPWRPADLEAAIDRALASTPDG